MKHFFSVICFFLFFTIANSQDKYLTKNGTVTFFSKAPIEDITAENNQVLSIIDSSNGNMAISILMKSFLFKKALMQEHFNENYLESDIYPKSTFSGKVIQNKNGKATVQGDLTIHGKTKKIKVEGLMIQNKKSVVISAEFAVKLEDYNIKIPTIVMYKIAEEIAIKVTIELKETK